MTMEPSQQSSVGLTPRANLLLEASWEVCNKVGGIYTVVKSKVAVTQQHYSNYYLIGPYFENMAKREFSPRTDAPAWLSQVFETLKARGIICHYGSWEIPGQPKTILLEYLALRSELNQIKGNLWEWYGVDTLSSGWDFEEPLLWCYAMSHLHAAIAAKSPLQPIAGHFHEWLAGLTILFLKKQGIAMGTTFTTHATMLGRTLCANDFNLYDDMESYNPDELAKRFGVNDKYTTERAVAHACDVFTTVSETTAMEAKYLLGREPKPILTNGLDLSLFPTMEENSLRHVYSREKIKEFFAYYFFPYYSFDLKHTLTFFILGRYEFKNKGIDYFIEALAQLDASLRKQGIKRTVVAFFWIPMNQHGMRLDVLENKDYYRHIKHYASWKSDDIITALIHNYISGNETTYENIFDEDFKLELRRDIHHFKRSGDPPLSTHHIDESNDQMVQALRSAGLTNKKENAVKVILFPVYLDGNDGFLNLSYYDAIAGCHLGVFPSYYEPFGYTPLEGAACGVPSVTTDLSGYGRFMIPYITNDLHSGVWVIKRHKRSREEAISELATLFLRYCEQDKHIRAQTKVNAQSLAKLCDWHNLIDRYIQAHNLSLGSAGETRG